MHSSFLLFSLRLAFATAWSTTACGSPSIASAALSPLDARVVAPAMAVLLDGPVLDGAPTQPLLESFLEHFQGHFDNLEQVRVNEAAGLTPREGGGHEHIHCVLRAVHIDLAAPARGASPLALRRGLLRDAVGSSTQHVLASYYFNGQPEMIFRQRLYALDAVRNDEQFGDCVRMSIFRLRDSTAQQVPAALSGSVTFSAADVSGELHVPGADVFWRRRGERFEGHMRTSAIKVISERSGREMIVRDDVVLWPDALWVNDRGSDAETGEYVYGNIHDVPYKMRRVPDTHWTVTGGPRAEAEE